MVTRYVFATVVGGKGGASFNYYLNGQGFLPIFPVQATFYTADQVEANKATIANQNGGMVAILPIVLEP